MSLAFQLLVFSAVFLTVLFLADRSRGPSAAGLVRARPAPFLFRHLAPLNRLFRIVLGGPLARAFPEAERKLREDLVSAAQPLESGDVRGLQVTAALSAGLGAFVLVSQFGGPDTPELRWLAPAFAALFGWSGPVSWARRKSEERRKAVSRSLPYALDLVSSSMEAGLDFAEAVRIYVNEGPAGPLGEELGRALNEVRMNKPRLEALQDLAARMRLPELQQLSSSLAIGDELGARIAGTLKLQAREMRRLRQHRIDREAEKAPSLMLFPMVLFIMPAVFVIIATPVFIRMKASGLGSMMNITP